MLIFFGILVILASVILGFIVLVQNPKGGGLSGSFGGVGNQLMGVKQTTDVLEKGTWVFASAVGILCLVSPAFMKGSTSSKNDAIYEKVAPSTKTATPANTGSLPTAAPDTPAKP